MAENYLLLNLVFPDLTILEPTRIIRPKVGANRGLKATEGLPDR